MGVHIDVAVVVMVLVVVVALDGDDGGGGGGDRWPCFTVLLLAPGSTHLGMASRLQRGPLALG